MNILKMLGVDRTDEKSIKKTTKVSYGGITIKKRTVSISTPSKNRKTGEIRIGYKNQY